MGSIETETHDWHDALIMSDIISIKFYLRKGGWSYWRLFQFSSTMHVGMGDTHFKEERLSPILSPCKHGGVRDELAIFNMSFYNVSDPGSRRRKPGRAWGLPYFRQIEDDQKFLIVCKIWRVEDQILRRFSDLVKGQFQYLRNYVNFNTNQTWSSLARRGSKIGLLPDIWNGWTLSYTLLLCLIL